MTCFLGLYDWNEMLIFVTEEVYFGKAKDVVGELRSMFSPILSRLVLSSYCVGANDYRRLLPLRVQQGTRKPRRDDPVDARVVGQIF